MNIITLTPNPSVDRTIDLAGPLQRGEVIRTTGGRTDPGGKGVNIARALATSGINTVAIFPGDATDPIIAMLEHVGVPTANVPTGVPIRTNVTITEPDGTTTKLNEPGGTVTDTILAALIESVAEHADGASWIVLAGSLPPGAPVDFYVSAVKALRERFGDVCPKIAVDTSGAPLKALVEGGADVDLIKPNEDELASVLNGVTGEELQADPSKIPDAVKPLFAKGIHAALVTLGGKGAVLVTEAGAWRGIMPPIEVKSTVGAGDSSLTGYVIKQSENGTPAECLAQAIAHGTAAAGLAGSIMPSRHDAHPELAQVTPLA